MPEHQASTRGFQPLQNESVLFNKRPHIMGGLIKVVIFSTFFGLYTWYALLEQTTTVGHTQYVHRAEGLEHVYHYLFGFILAFAVGVLIVVLLNKNRRYIVTDQRVLKKGGFIRKSTTEVPISEVTSITTSTGIFERIFGAGTVNITSRGAVGKSGLFGQTGSVKLKHLPKYNEIAATIRQHQQQYTEETRMKAGGGEMGNQIIQ